MMIWDDSPRYILLDCDAELRPYGEMWQGTSNVNVPSHLLLVIGRNSSHVQFPTRHHPAHILSLGTHDGLNINIVVVEESLVVCNQVQVFAAVTTHKYDPCVIGFSADHLRWSHRRISCWSRTDE